jgi:hypothetical protein
LAENPLKRRDIAKALAAFGMAPLLVSAQPVRKLPLLGFMFPGAERTGITWPALLDGLRTLGYVEGQTIRYEARWANGKPEQLPLLAQELVRLKVDVLVAVSPAAVRAAKSATGEIPIVAYDLETEPVASGLVASLARPGGNLTGMFLDLPSLAAKWLKVEADNAGRVKVNNDLSVPNMPNVYVIGDTAAANCWNGKPVPGLAPAAKQGGIYVARTIHARLFNKPVEPFVYNHLGSLATIGRKAAVADFGKFKLCGSTAWWLWGFVHVFFLVGTRNRITVILNWLWSYVTFRASTRLITGGK